MSKDFLDVDKDEFLSKISKSSSEAIDLVRYVRYLEHLAARSEALLQCMDNEEAKALKEEIRGTVHVN